LNITYYKPSELIAAEYNPRQLTRDQHKELTDSIVRFGLVDPLIVNIHKERKNILVGGHQRLKIAQELNIKEIPCVEVELNPDQEKELNIRLNKNSGEWDYDALANNFDVGELTEWGFSDTDFGVDYSEANQEIDVDEFSEKMTLKFELSKDEYDFVNQQLATVNENKELALLGLLEYES